MKMKKVPGVLGEFFSDSSNAAKVDADGNYVWRRDPTYFKYIMDYIRDGSVAWPTDAAQLEMLLEECDFFELGNMVCKQLQPFQFILAWISHSSNVLRRCCLSSRS